MTSVNISEFSMKQMLNEAHEIELLPALTDTAHDAPRAENPVKERDSGHRAHLSGWKFGVRASIVATGIVLVINTASTVFIFAKYNFNGGIHVMHEGSCTYAKRLNLLLHLLINIIGTVLLAASNYCMQGLSAPTREEVNEVHLQRNWLNIGVPGFRNLRLIDKRRCRLWVLICVSSLPLHLLFNSAIFSSISAHQYSVLALAANYESSENWTPHLISDNPTETTRIGKMQRDYEMYERLSKDTCIQEYGKQYLLARRNVILVSKMNSTDASVALDYKYITPRWDPFTPADPFRWICGETEDSHCDISSILRETSWNITRDKPVQYCLSEKVPEQCQVYFSSGIMIAVIVSNLVKFISMWLAAKSHTSSCLITCGDAIASFLATPDEMTKGMCLVTRRDFRKWGRESNHNSPRRWMPRKYFWFETVSRRRWTLFISLALGSFITCCMLIWTAVRQLAARGVPTDLKALWAMGLGTVNIFSLTFPGGDFGRAPFGVKSLLGAAALVNVPQLILSLDYFILNSVITAMFAAKEWMSFATERKGLRVTTPTGEQRSTYFLHVPYRFGIPLISFSALLHWFVSQSFFLAKVVALEDGKEDLDNSITIFGFSAIGMIFTTITGFVLLLSVFTLGLRRSDAKMPLMSNCSATISAACHPSMSEGNIAARRLQWGVSTVESDIEHCSFSSKEGVQPLILGHLYC